MDMTGIFVMGDSPAVGFAGEILKKQGIPIYDAPDRAVSHVLLNVPTSAVALPDIGEDVTVIGGNLDGISGHPTMDLLRQEQYLAENAAITADCALRLLGMHLPVMFCSSSVLIIGWGRIGKCLAQRLKSLGARVTVAARKPGDIAMLSALGYGAVEVKNADPTGFDAIVNTAPAPISLPDCNGIKIDLASKKGLPGEDVIWARGLPGKMLPKASGMCIARGILRRIREESL